MQKTISNADAPAIAEIHGSCLFRGSDGAGEPRPMLNAVCASGSEGNAAHTKDGLPSRTEDVLVSAAGAQKTHASAARVTSHC